MNSTSSIVFPGLLLLATAGWAGPADLPMTPGAAATANGAYSIHFYPGAASFPPGVTFICRVRIMPFEGGNSGSATGRGSGSAFGCALEVPLTWPETHGRTAATLSYEIDAVAPDGSMRRAAARQGIPVPRPPAGGTARIDLAF